MTEVTAKGFREIDAKLATLGSQKGTRIIRRALLVAADPIVEQASHNVRTQSSDSGALARSIGRRFVIGAKSVASEFLPSLGQRFAAVIAPFRGDRIATALYNLAHRRKRKGIFHGHLIEFDHRTRSGGSVPGRPFLLPALRSRTGDAVNIFRAEVKDGIERELKRK